jgi:cephalosporin-C deacetylase-like acetyl esterase
MCCDDKTINEQSVIFKNSRDQRLFGILHLPLKETRPSIVIMAHGFTDDRTGDNRLFVKFARKAAKAGIAVLRFDFAGSGDSEGDFAEATLNSEIEDLKSAVDFIYNLSEIDNSRINLIGYSLGGAVSIALAAVDERIKSFIGWAPVSDFKTTFQRILGKRVFSLAKDDTLIACRNGDKQFYLRKEFF